MELAQRPLEQGLLAYVFWHWPRPGTAVDAYERDLTAFQDRLRGAGVPGLRAVTTFRLGQAPWASTAAAPPPPPLYEDWYVVDGFAALETLNTAAVGPALLPSHDRAARAAAGGTAGLYTLRRAGGVGTDRPAGGTGNARGAVDGPVAHWFAKPDGMSSAALDALLETAAPSASLWQRQMTLGPGAEFCLAAPTTLVTLPAELAPRSFPREPVT